ncbi:MAG: hypothetical protein Q8L59_08130 [Phenylobacterium sp.]|uniref:hypothetical protein n=1 Tax=Phenylobacterium sp. TaxID=1871053 RepID=UPI0027352F76|nr:hypothetical protein [Phenylobacterium sp.]MDP1642138.1 hypothetical protein [Phenylobacterium sp.]MDP3115600.1 hypothetical protein [Phenylobacterium sp.]MDP3385511.1 hypothetical protein [Phenylobacterium sp.]
MDFLNDRRVVLSLVGGALALLAGMGIAVGLLARGGDEPAEDPPASKAGLVVETTEMDDGRLDPARPLRCFVGGQFVGEVTLSECAQRNGVATGALDVGVDETGALAAADAAGTVLTPLPPPVETVTPAATAPREAAAPSATETAAQAAPAGACWRYTDAEWRRLPGDLTLNACVQALFAGRCESPGGATYGRWMQQTLRLVPGRVEVSADNRRFRTLAEQGAGCAIAPIG